MQWEANGDGFLIIEFEIMNHFSASPNPALYPTAKIFQLYSVCHKQRLF